jgi:hypothetical protein
VTGPWNVEGMWRVMLPCSHWEVICTGISDARYWNAHVSYMRGKEEKKLYNFRSYTPMRNLEKNLHPLPIRLLHRRNKHLYINIPMFRLQMQVLPLSLWHRRKAPRDRGFRLRKRRKKGFGNFHCWVDEVRVLEVTMSSGNQDIVASD